MLMSLEADKVKAKKLAAYPIQKTGNRRRYPPPAPARLLIFSGAGLKIDGTGDGISKGFWLN
jgi:hypothetical protein